MAFIFVNLDYDINLKFCVYFEFDVMWLIEPTNKFVCCRTV